MNAPRINRSKSLDLTRTGPDRYRLSGRLTDTSHHGEYGTPLGREHGSPQAVIHDFLVEGELAGPDLVVLSLQVSTGAHPYRECPAMLPSCGALVGRSLARGWRSVVLDTLGGTAGCTHVTTLLLGLAEARTMAIFLQMNTGVEYSPQARDDGRWTAEALSVAPAVAGACHALVDDGSVIGKARRLARNDGDETTTRD